MRQNRSRSLQAATWRKTGAQVRYLGRWRQSLILSDARRVCGHFQMGKRLPGKRTDPVDAMIERQNSV